MGYIIRMEWGQRLVALFSRKYSINLMTDIPFLANMSRHKSSKPFATLQKPLLGKGYRSEPLMKNQKWLDVIKCLLSGSFLKLATHLGGHSDIAPTTWGPRCHCPSLLGPQQMNPGCKGLEALMNLLSFLDSASQCGAWHRWFLWFRSVCLWKVQNSTDVILTGVVTEHEFVWK